MYRALAASRPGGALEPFEYDPGELADDDVEIAVEYCGFCHSDLSMLANEWRISRFPLVPGHEVIGTVAATGSQVSQLKVGQQVGLGWRSRSCLLCDQCISGCQHRCSQVSHGAETIVGRHGGFANRVRCQAAWAIPLPAELDARSAGPLFCAGVTVFSPLVLNSLRPTSCVAVVGVGGLGHLAIQFVQAWGCDVTAISTSADKEAEARQLGASHFLIAKDSAALKSAINRFDLVLSTVNVPLDWDRYVALLRPGGHLHIVGAVPSVTVTWFPLIVGEKSVGGSPIGSPGMVREMLVFAARHQIKPLIEEFPMSRVNDAVDHLKNGRARYRIVLTNDLEGAR